MGVLAPRLFFVGFVGLTVAITYNALYLQPAGRGLPNLGAEVQEPGKPTGDPARAASSPKSTLVLAVQRELAERGYDPGAADGSPGQKTGAAIKAYQRTHNLPETGLATDQLLKQILFGETAALASADKPARVKAAEPKRAPEKPTEAKRTVEKPAETKRIVEQAAETKRTVEKPAETKRTVEKPAETERAADKPGEIKIVRVKTIDINPADAKSNAETRPLAPATTGSAAPAGVVRDVQQVLADLGYTPGQIDGEPGAGTRKAITAFEKDRGLKPSGEISPKLLRELKRITGREISAGG